MRIGFISPTVLAALQPSSGIREIGGAELQLVQIARLLRALGHEAVFVTVDAGQGEEAVIDGFRVLGAYRPQAGIPGLRYLSPRWTGLWRAISRAGADVYITRGASLLPGMLAMQRNFRTFRFVFAGASDSDFLPGEAPLVRFARDRWLYRYGLQRADAIVVQSLHQQELVRRHYGREATVIPNFFDLPPVTVPEERRTQVLWVGRMRAIKRPEFFLDLARALPQLSFTMIAPRSPAEADLYERVAAAAATIPNLRFHGFRPFEEVEAEFDRCRVLVCTSRMEGFPNVFLQAMRRGIPIVSTVDPDGLIGRNGIGAVVGSVADLGPAVGRLATAPPSSGEAIRGVYARSFSPDAVRDSYRRLLDGLSA